MEPSPSLPLPPAWVCQRDGSLVPFEADKISRSLFAATESLGRPDAFLARELTDSVLHFLAAEVEGAIVSTAQIAEMVAKVVRELGRPALAQAFADRARQRTESAQPGVKKSGVVVHFATSEPVSAIVPACVRNYTLQAVFARDLVAAQTDGLLTLTGLEAPLELAGCVLRGTSQAGGGLVEAIEEARRVAGVFLTMDGPEYLLAAGSRRPDEAVVEYARELGIGLRATGLAAVVNLNSAVPPSWTDDLADGPLFAGQRRSPSPERLPALLDALLEQLPNLKVSPGKLRIDWHLSERDLLPETEGRLLHLARLAVGGAPLAFVFDRPRWPIQLAEGIDRQHPAVLLTVGLHLPCLAEQPDLRADPALFLQKLGSLVRLALSAALQKRDFLLRHSKAQRGGDAVPPAVTQGFLLDRARLVVAPVGLESAVATLAGRGLSEGGPALDLARQVVQRLDEVLRHDGRHVATCLDGPATFTLRPDQYGGGEIRDIAGLTPWDVTAAAKGQLRAAGTLHDLAEMGTAALLLPEERPPTAEQVADWLRFAWRQTKVVRLRLVRVSASHRQLTLTPPLS